MENFNIKYPCYWEYKIIGESLEALKKAAAEVLGSKKYNINLSNKSKTGKYFSLELKVKVADKAERNKIFSCLGGHSGVKVIL